MARSLALAALLLIAGCGSEPANPDQPDTDRQAIAAVEAAQRRKPPVQPAAPEPLTVADQRRPSLNKTVCTVRGTESASPLLIMAGDHGALLRITGELETLAADVGGQKIGGNAWQHYLGKRFALTIRPDGSEPAPHSAVTIQIRDPYGRPVYTAKGQLACPA